MVIIAGANGSGKSSNTLSFAQQGYDVIDPDRIARNLSPFSPEKAALSAGKSAINRARENICLGNSFTIETTLASKGVYQRLVKEAINNNFDIKLMYISTVSPDININRVASRVAKGGHNVPEADIIRRYERSLDNLGFFFDKASEVILIDNSSNELNLQLHINDEKLIFAVEKSELANWVLKGLGQERLNLLLNPSPKLLVKSVSYAGSYKLNVSLSNGSRGFFDISPYITKGVFKELADKHYLKQVKVDDSGMGICWPNGQDLSANTLESELIHNQ